MVARAQYRKPGQLRPNERVFSTLPFGLRGTVVVLSFERFSAGASGAAAARIIPPPFNLTQRGRDINRLTPQPAPIWIWIWISI